jgi:hypothetical protein
VRFLLAIVVLWAAPVQATAQPAEPSPAEMRAARRLFQSGLRAARDGRWDEALRDFERSYAIAEVPTTLLNLAGAQVQTGRLVTGAASYRLFLTRAEGGRAAAYRGEAEAALRAVEARIPRITVRVRGLAADDAIELDGSTVSRGEVGTPLPVDPGEHVIRVRRDGATAAEERVSVSEGERRQLVLSVPALPVARVPSAGGPLERTGADDDDDRSAAASPWLWTGVGAAVVAGVLTAVLVTRGRGSDLYRGNVDPGRVEF